jgi:hypothetical protein
VLQYTPKVDKVIMEVFGDFYKDYIAYQKTFEFVLAFMSKEIREEYISSFTKGGKQSLKRLFLSRIPYGIGERIIDDVPLAKRDAITNIYELIHRMQREMNKIHEFHRKCKDVEKKLSQTTFSNKSVRVSKEYRKYPTAGNVVAPRKTYGRTTPRVQTMQYSSEASDEERVYYDAKDDQPGVNFTTQPKMGKTPPKRDAKQFTTASTLRGKHRPREMHTSWCISRSAEDMFFKVLGRYMYEGKQL